MGNKAPTQTDSEPAQQMQTALELPGSLWQEHPWYDTAVEGTYRHLRGSKWGGGKKKGSQNPQNLSSGIARCTSRGTETLNQQL